jgi:hypothetical protein
MHDDLANVLIAVAGLRLATVLALTAYNGSVLLG